MPTKVTFERIVFDQGTGGTIKSPSGKAILDPGFGDLGVAWRAMKSKGLSQNALLWSSPLPGRYTQDEAKAICAQRGGRLPTKEEYEELVTQWSQYKGRGGVTRLHDLMGWGEDYYWSASVYSRLPLCTYVFHGSSGCVHRDDNPYYFKQDRLAVCCVRR